MKKISLKLERNEDHSLNILIGQNLNTEILKYLTKTQIGKKYAIIADATTYKLYGKYFSNFLRTNNIHCETLFFTPGEKSKNLQTIEKLANEMIFRKFDRKDAIIALGGGVVGDISGFLASIYMRGIPYIQIPTTLMAMSDSSIGGKTGVDLESGKNLLGTINQPKAIFIDTEYLKTLPLKQIKNGLSEIIKYGVIKDEKMFNFIEQKKNSIIKLDTPSIVHIIEKSAAIKAKIVEEDEKEEGRRMILNYGHTYGHAIEKISGYKLLHGYAISIGMVMTNKMAVEKGLMKKKDAERIKKLLKDVGLPTTTMKKPSMKDLLPDKKKSGDNINFILPTKIGNVIIEKIKCQ
jgi:3-dehydroquinate synthase